MTFRAVRPEDYAEAAERLPWVQRAGAAFVLDRELAHRCSPRPTRGELRPDAVRARSNSSSSSTASGRPAARRTCATPCTPTSTCGFGSASSRTPYRGRGQGRACSTRSSAPRGHRPRRGFFDPDNFTFGTPLRRAALQAAIQAVPGVRAVERMRIRRRGWFDWRDFTEPAYQPGDNEVIRRRQQHAPAGARRRPAGHGGWRMSCDCDTSSSRPALAIPAGLTARPPAGRCAGLAPRDAGGARPRAGAGRLEPRASRTTSASCCSTGGRTSATSSASTTGRRTRRLPPHRAAAAVAAQARRAARLRSAPGRGVGRRATAALADGRQTITLVRGHRASDPTSFGAEPPQVFELGADALVASPEQPVAVARVVPTQLDPTHATAGRTA